MIKGYVGEIGSGKTLFLVRDAQWFFANNYKVFSNMPMWGYNRKREKVTSEFLFPDAFMEKVRSAFVQKEPTLFVIDEATLVLSAYNWKKTDNDLLMFISQSRKFNIHIFYTSQRYKDVIVPLRENVSAVVVCKKHFFKPFYQFMGLVVDKNYFLDRAVSQMQNSYILGRKWGLFGSMTKWYNHYITHFIVMTQALAEDFKEIIGDPTNITVEDIVRESKKHIDVQPPL